MVISSGTAFLIVLFYLISLLAARVSIRRFYKNMWKGMAIVLGIGIVGCVAWYLIGYVAVLLAI